jgi:hypothetical protein
LKFILLIFFALAVQLDNLAVKKYGRYSFFAPPADSLIVRDLNRILIENEPVFQKVYRYAPRQLQRDVLIYIPQNDEDYFKLSESALPDWSGGVAFPDEHKVILRPPQSGFFDPREYREVLLHELAHIYLADKADTCRVPLWFNEGLAMQLSGRTFSWNDHLVISSAVISHGLLDLPEVDRMLVFGLAKAQLAYAQSLLAVQLLIRNSGEKAIGDLLDGLAAGNNWEQVFAQVYDGSDDGQFNRDLQQYIHQQYRWALLLQVKNLFWIMLVILVICGFILIKIRNRRILKEWEKNEDI